MASADIAAPNPVPVARIAGASLLATIVIGFLGAMFLVSDIDINLSGDVAATAENMLQAEQRLRGRAYLAGLVFGLEILFLMALFLLLRRTGPLLAAWSVALGVAAAIVSLLGAVFALNAAEFADNEAYRAMGQDSRLLLASLQATSDYTSFHFSLVLGSIAKAGFFALFLRSNLVPRLLAAWGVFASLFVASTIVARDFVPALGNETVTVAFMASNLIALVAVGFYLSVWGVRQP